jgi:hypothetical protein
MPTRFGGSSGRWRSAPTFGPNMQLARSPNDRRRTLRATRSRRVRHERVRLSLRVGRPSRGRGDSRGERGLGSPDRRHRLDRCVGRGDRRPRPPGRRHDGGALRGRDPVHRKPACRSGDGRDRRRIRIRACTYRPDVGRLHARRDGASGWRLHSHHERPEDSLPARSST